ncbi:MAG: hypothetical protein U9R58_03920 [Chloroflexota bacterium]|nr:hypothetical protein [Chloroflexota bacterium]
MNPRIYTNFHQYFCKLRISPNSDPFSIPTPLPDPLGAHAFPDPLGVPAEGGRRRGRGLDQIKGCKFGVPALLDLLGVLAEG